MHFKKRNVHPTVGVFGKANIIATDFSKKDLGFESAIDSAEAWIATLPDDDEMELQPVENHALTVFGGVVAVISSIVGGGIVGLPYVFY